MILSTQNPVPAVPALPEFNVIHDELMAPRRAFLAKEREALSQAIDDADRARQLSEMRLRSLHCQRDAIMTAIEKLDAGYDAETAAAAPKSYLGR